ncbi:MAG: cytochrome c oxidase subunit I [Burkholderiales bacterium]|nr:cytochrome c oxidase subunit I [Burkholderiales bacterium]
MKQRTPPSPVALHHRLQRVWSSPGGWRSVMAVNHNIVGRRFIMTALAFFFIGGVLAMMIRAQLATPQAAFLDDALYSQVFTMHGTLMMFLFAIPLIEGFAIYLLPKMIGARDLAYPRLGAFGYWCYLLGGLILLGALAMGVAPDGGWFLYTPLSNKVHTPGVNADVWLLGITFVEISAIAAAVEIVVTILTMRAPGMSLSRMPLFAWYMLVTAGMMLIGFPPLILGSLILELERAAGWPFFDAARGGDPLLWQHLFWLFGHPEVYIIFLPAAGIVSTLIPTFARRPIVGHDWIVASIVAMGFVSFGLWVHHMFTVGIPHLALVFFSAASMLVALPTAVQFFAWIATLWHGRPKFELPMLWLLGFLVVFVLGGLTGVMLALVPFNWQAHDTHFVVAHLHYVLVGGFVFPFMAGIYYWYPHMFGRHTFPRLGAWAFWLVFGGFNLTFFVMHLTGLLGMPRRIGTYSAGLGWEWLNLVSSIGGFVMSIGFFLLLIDLLLSAYLGRRAVPNPWHAPTLEWAMPTPPAFYNIASQPRVKSREPLWRDDGLPAQIAAGRGLLGQADVHEQQTLASDPATGEPTHVIRLPRPSVLPLACGVAVGSVFMSLLLGLYWLAPVGAAVSLVLFWRWAWSIGLRHDPSPIDAGEGLMLPVHDVAPRAPGRAGLMWTLVADGTFFVSLLFGYAYLGTIAPGWPPPQWLQSGLLLPIAAAAALLATCGLCRAALRANARGDGARRQALLLATVASALAATALLPASVLPGMPPPTQHAYGAIVAFALAYGVVHAALGVVFAAYAWARGRAGFLSAARRVELGNAALWWDFMAVTGLVLLLALHVPAALAR